MRLSRLLILLLIVLAFLQYAYYAPLLPERVASHFDAAGRADGWSSKTGFLLTTLLTNIGIALMFLGLTSLLRKIPSAWMNLPNKDYWLAPERRTATLGAIQQQMEWLAAATLVLMLGITQLTIQANLGSVATQPSGAFWLLFGSYMAFMVTWLIWLLRKWYAKVPRRDDEQ